MRSIHLAIVLCAALVTSACSKKQAAVPAKPAPSNTEPAAGTPGAGDTANPVTPASDTKPESGTRGPVKKGGDPCEGGQ